MISYSVEPLQKFESPKDNKNIYKLHKCTEGMGDTDFIRSSHPVRLQGLSKSKWDKWLILF